MDADSARQFIRDNHRAVLATLRSDGQPQLSPVTVGLDDHDRVIISTRETAMKVHNLRRSPRAWLCVMTERFFGDWAQIEGEVEIVPLPEAMDILVEYYRSVSGEHPDWDEYRQAMVDQRRVILRVSIDRAGPSRAG
ncbi:MAG TPA: PPOX class F420-dependent oxidoreductase [Acidimicrobiales bacterium]|nr:PPOX class F420-dependent oxidoreductase [Acidimicrobiales bacterium]